VPSLVEVGGLTLPPPPQEGRMVGAGAAAVPARIAALRNEAKVL